MERIPQATVTGSYGFGWQQMWKYFLHLFLISVVIGFANAPLGIINDYETFTESGRVVSAERMVFLQIIAAGYMLLVLPVLKYGANLLYLRGIRDEKIDFQEMFGGFKKNYLNIILANLLTFAIIGLGFVFLIVPGIILAVRLAFVPYLVMDKELEPVAAVEKSWAMTRGHGWTIFGMGLLTIPIVIGGLIALFVGVIFAVIWISAAFAAMYHAVDLEDKKKLNGNGDGGGTDDN
ncbi:MAG: hypothetical protein ABFS32_11505 [Bacteroidota bacterium]